MRRRRFDLSFCVALLGTSSVCLAAFRSHQYEVVAAALGGMLALVAAWCLERTTTAAVIKAAVAASWGTLLLDPVKARNGCPLQPVPVNVRVHKDDDTFVPLELRYRGHLDGKDHWAVVNLPVAQVVELAITGDRWHLDADFMPKPCQIDFVDHWRNARQ